MDNKLRYYHWAIHYNTYCPVAVAYAATLPPGCRGPRISRKVTRRLRAGILQRIRGTGATRYFE